MRAIAISQEYSVGSPDKSVRLCKMGATFPKLAKSLTISQYSP